MTRSRSHLCLAAALTLAVLAVPLAACGSDSGKATGPIVARLADYTITPSRVSTGAGPVTFDIDNGSDVMTHEFLVVKTDLDPADLPIDEEGAVDEKGEGVEFIDEREDIEPGEHVSLTVDLAPGRYLLLCNLDDHYARGMYRIFEVEP